MIKQVCSIIYYIILYCIILYCFILSINLFSNHFTLYKLNANVTHSETYLSAVILISLYQKYWMNEWPSLLEFNLYLAFLFYFPECIAYITFFTCRFNHSYTFLNTYNTLCAIVSNS